jgi:hypothetical protein
LASVSPSDASAFSSSLSESLFEGFGSEATVFESMYA